MDEFEGREQVVSRHGNKSQETVPNVENPKFGRDPDSHTHSHSQSACAWNGPELAMERGYWPYTQPLRLGNDLVLNLNHHRDCAELSQRRSDSVKIELSAWKQARMSGAHA